MQIVVGLDFTFYDSLNPNSTGSGFNRYPGFFHDPQKFAQFLVMLSFVFLYDHKTKKITYGSMALFGITTYALFLTGSRSALIGLCVGVLVLLVFLDVRMKIAVLAGAVLGAIPLIYFSNTFLILGRIGEFNENYRFRNSIWKSALEIFADNPLLGIGSGNYQNYMRDHATDQYFIYENAVQISTSQKMDISKF